MPADHDQCAGFLVAQSAALGADVVATTLRPADHDHNAFSGSFECPHGTTYYVRPTVAQHAAWAATNTA